MKRTDDQQHVLILCQESEVPLIQERWEEIKPYHIETDSTEEIFQRGPEAYLREMIDFLNKSPDRFDGIIGTRDVTSVFSNVICEKTRKLATSIDSMINCQNKYISRKIQKEKMPENTPDFWLDSQFLREFPLVPPFFAKPVRANISYGSKKCDSYDELRELIRKNTADLSNYNQYYLDALAVSGHLNNQLNLETYNRFLCEELVSGDQITVNGYIINSEVTCYGIVKAAFHEDKISFSHHEMPFDGLSAEMEKRINKITAEVAKATGLNNTFFNVEMRIDQETGAINIIEVNSRAAFQFVGMTEAILGINFVQWLCDLSVGKVPGSHDDQLYEREKYPCCYNFELREFGDREILKVPMTTELEHIHHLYPEVTVKNMVSADSRLSDYKQNLESYRYCIMDVPGKDKKDVLEKYEIIKSMLGYEFR